MRSTEALFVVVFLCLVLDSTRFCLLFILLVDWMSRRLFATSDELWTRAWKA